jgi:RimJ/RimL family protein N-acetyltransferase/dephospho-CoA kinase
MNIQNNILKHHIKNVYFICGTACAGKTTMAKLLAEKHGFYLYDMDKEYAAHRAIAQEEYQPDTCYHGKNFHEQWMRPIKEQARWSMNTLKEQTEMVLIDLIKLSEKQIVVADVLYSPDYIQELVDYHQLVFLTVDKARIRETYFNRPEKREFYEYVKQQELQDTYFDNIFQSLEQVNEMEQERMRDSGFLCIERTADSTREEMLTQIEKHFGLYKENASVSINTERLYIRPFAEKDFTQFETLLDLYPGWQLQKPHARQFFDWYLSNYKTMDIEHDYICLGIFLKESDKLIGNVGLNEHDDLHVPELGYGILTDYRGKGYAKEAAKATLLWAKSFFNIPYLVGTAEVSNIASQKVLEYCGFSLEGINNLEVHITQQRYDFKTYKYNFYNE